MRRWIKRASFAVSLILVSPLIFLSWLEKNSSRRENLFVALGQLLALIPGIVGSYLRNAYYFGTLEKCSWEVRIGFGSYFSQRLACLGRNVSMGSYCIIGAAAIDDGVMIASRVSIPSGKYQHLDANGGMSAETRSSRISIGTMAWIGEGAIVLADVGDRSIVAAGTVVTKNMPGEKVIAGNPGRIIRALDSEAPRLAV